MSLHTDSRLRRLAALLLAVLVLGACHPQPQPQLSPKGEAAYQAHQVVKALDILRDAAVEAEAQQPQLLSTETTRKVVQFHKAAVSSAGGYPEGWKASVVAGLDQLRGAIPAADYQKLEPYVALLRALLQ